jgi:transposase-like protein
MSEKKKRRRCEAVFKREAVARMRACGNVTALTRELGIDRKML